MTISYIEEVAEINTEELILNCQRFSPYYTEEDNKWRERYIAKLEKRLRRLKKVTLVVHNDTHIIRKKIPNMFNPSIRQEE